MKKGIEKKYQKPNENKNFRYCNIFDRFKRIYLPLGAAVSTSGLASPPLTRPSPGDLVFL